MCVQELNDVERDLRLEQRFCVCSAARCAVLAGWLTWRTHARTHARRKEISIHDFEMGPIIGRGAFGEVFYCRRTP